MMNNTPDYSTSRLTIVDHGETYGRHILDDFTHKNTVYMALDLGCGDGDDLQIVKKNSPDAALYGVDCFPANFSNLKEKNIQPLNLNIECESLPFEDETIDLVIANQVLEHTKEIFWINHEVFRTLKIGGYFYIGVPNVLSFHNRLLGLIGVHPTQHKLLSAHVRPFSNGDTIRFYRTNGCNFMTLERFAGSQFYPLPKTIARTFSTVFPSLSFSIFFVFKKTAVYQGEFLQYLKDVPLPTNFKC
ncbi:MAG: class I SAM-dependent methyltransferase [Pseudanabaena sp.]